MLTLRAGASSLVVVPACGAGVTGWMLGPTPIFRRALPQATTMGDPRAMGCYPLLPYGNRIANGHFRWLGTDYRLKANFGDHPHTIHGIGWQRPWQVTAVSTCAATLTLPHRPDESWPFAFDATIAYALSPADLSIRITLTNRHPTPAPAGIGIHPYFPKTHAPSLRFDASGVWDTGADQLPSRHRAPPEDWRHCRPRPIAGSRLDHCFTGWTRDAEIHAGPASLHIEASAAFSQLQVFTPSWADFFCIEPVSHIPDAINRSDLPDAEAMNILQPNETLSGSVRLMPTFPPDRATPTFV